MGKNVLFYNVTDEELAEEAAHKKHPFEKEGPATEMFEAVGQEPNRAAVEKPSLAGRGEERLMEYFAQQAKELGIGSNPFERPEMRRIEPSAHHMQQVNFAEIEKRVMAMAGMESSAASGTVQGTMSRETLKLSTTGDASQFVVGTEHALELNGERLEVLVTDVSRTINPNHQGVTTDLVLTILKRG